MDSESIQNYVYPNECYQKLLFVGLPYPQVSGSFIVEHIVDDRVFIQIEFDIFEDRRTLDIDDQTYFLAINWPGKMSISLAILIHFSLCHLP